MRAPALLVATSLASLLAACGGGGDFAADFAAAKANVATLEGGALDHAIGQRMATPENGAAVAKCVAEHAPAQPLYRGVMAFERGRGYRIRFEVDDAHSRCLAGIFEGKDMPEPPDRPYLLPVEIGDVAK